MLILLQTRGKMTASTLAGELGVSRRTILRDVEALSFSGVPVYTEDGHGGGISLDERYRTSLTGLREAEVRVLFIRTSPQLLQDLGLAEAATTSQQKLSAALPGPHKATVDAIQQRIYIDPTRWWHETEMPAFWPVLQHAVFEDMVIKVTYTNHEGKIADRILEPYSLVAKAGVWYLVARHNAAFRTYRIERIVRLEKTGSRFVRDDGFDLPAHWHRNSESFRSEFTGYEFTADIHPDRLAFVRWIAPGRHSMTSRGADGWTRVHFQMETEEMAVMFAFALGAQARICAPDTLKHALAAACDTLLRHIRP